MEFTFLFSVLIKGVAGVPKHVFIKVLCKTQNFIFRNRHPWSTILYIMRTCVYIGLKKGNKANISLSHSTSLNQTYHV